MFIHISSHKLNIRHLTLYIYRHGKIYNKCISYIDYKLTYLCKKHPNTPIIIFN